MLIVQYPRVICLHVSAIQFLTWFFMGHHFNKGWRSEYGEFFFYPWFSEKEKQHWLTNIAKFRGRGNKFHLNPFVTSWELLLTDRQTNERHPKNMTFFAKEVMSHCESLRMISIFKGLNLQLWPNHLTWCPLVALEFVKSYYNFYCLVTETLSFILSGHVLLKLDFSWFACLCVSPISIFVILRF